VARVSWAGWCPVCERSTTFRSYGPWHRDQLFCTRCRSIPRHRAIVEVLSIVRPDWRQQRIWELAPAGPASRKLRRECQRYIGSHYRPEAPLGAVVKGNRSEDLERPTFDDGSFDIIVSSDVLEHIVDVDTAHAQIARVLADDGIHLWTVPLHQDITISRPRVTRSATGLEHLLPAEYHGDPMSAAGALVTFDWGRDLPDRVAAASGMWTSVVRVENRAHGLLGEFLEILLSYNGPPDSAVRHAADPVHAQLSGRSGRILLRLPALPSWKSWWVTERARDIRAAVRRVRDRPQS
jgi:SAM-dependent methyltransferase